MFAQTFCDSPLELSRKKLTTLISFSFETLAVVALISLPLFHTEKLPSVRNVATVFTPVILADAPVHPQQATPSPVSLPFGVLDSSHLRTPSSIPNSISNAGNTASQLPGVPWGDVHTSGNPLSEIAGTGMGARPVQQPPPDHPIMVSKGVMEGALLQKIVPTYPRVAMMTHTEGEIVMRAVISRTGTIENLQVISGSPFLSRAAIDAVRQWRYRPYELNGQPVEVETQIVVNFTLSGK
ncbi:MAG TPA: energy transducer TonB [Terriglobales bacterium]|jgi:protein TonB